MFGAALSALYNKTSRYVVVDHADGLHIGIDNGKPIKFMPRFFKSLKELEIPVYQSEFLSGLSICFVSVVRRQTSTDKHRMIRILLNVQGYLYVLRTLKTFKRLRMMLSFAENFFNSRRRLVWRRF